MTWSTGQDWLFDLSIEAEDSPISAQVQDLESQFQNLVLDMEARARMRFCWPRSEKENLWNPGAFGVRSAV